MADASAIQSERACCYRLAQSVEAGFCPDCGKPVVRCMAHAECGSVLNDGERCEVCVWPELTLDAGAMVEASRGGAMSLPLTVRNLSPVGLPLFVTGIYSREGRGEWEQEPQSWERLDKGRSAPVVVRADDLDKVGAHRIEILLLVASRWRWREERFAFTAGLTLTVSEPDTEGGHNIQIQGDSVGPTTVYVSDRRTRESTVADTRDAPVELALTRADTAEREFGLRGHADGTLTPRWVALRFSGFGADEAPLAGPIAGEGGLYRAGRERTRAAGGQGDIRLLVRGADGQLDEALSRSLSRHHFDLYVESGRLMLRVQAQYGLKLNDRNCRRGDLVEINDGDVIRPLAKSPGAIALRADFEIHNGVTDSVTLSALAPHAPGA